LISIEISICSAKSICSLPVDYLSLSIFYLGEFQLYFWSSIFSPKLKIDIFTYQANI
jgi:hypothetical protein